MIEFIPDHSLGPLYAAQGWEVEDDPGAFARFVEWLRSVNPKHMWEEPETMQCSWIFEPDSDGPFWLKVMWCSDIETAGEYDSWDDGFDEREYFAQQEEWNQEDREIDEENEFARRLRTKTWGMNERAPMWSRLSHHRASRKFTQKSKDRHSWGS